MRSVGLSMGGSLPIIAICAARKDSRFQGWVIEDTISLRFHKCLQIHISIYGSTSGRLILTRSFAVKVEFNDVPGRIELT